ncbi:reticulocyte-binding protein homolog 2a-like [Platichthys flesus]|uniref:reticulocyte-binding protein homolog 2a-like n=1 Tax=Platichthys flesus TaxID=8260 RepID=UPI002DBF0418|nr:reticulocyte-binding protein homolog 2a-like [Platichthys flesus]
MMAKSREHVESFLEEFREQLTAGVTSPGATTEACMSQQHRPITEDVTPEEQKRVLFHTGQEVTSQSKDSVNHILTQEEQEFSADLEQRHNSSNINQLEDKSTQVNMKTNWETIQRKRPLTFQLMDEIEQHWERERNEIRCLKTKTEQQQKDIDRLTAEKHNQYLVIKALGVKMVDVIEKLQKNKNEATQEKMQLLTLQAEIYQERTTLDRRHNEIINEQCKFEMIKFDRSKFVSKEVQEIMDSLLSAMNKKIIITAKQAKQKIEKNLEDVKEELDRNKKDISQQRDQIEQIQHSLSINISKVKQRWIEFQRNTEIQRVTVPETGRRDGKQEGTDTSESVKEKLSRIRQEIEKVWDVLEDSQQQLDVTVREKQEVHTQSIQMENVKSNSPQLRQETDTHMKVTHCETLIKTDIQSQKLDIENNLRQIQWEKHEIERINTRIQAERKSIERERQSAIAEMDALKCMRESNERQRQELDDKLQRTKREIRELEVMNSEIEIKKKDLLKTIRMSRRKKQISEMKKKTEHSTQDLEDGQNVMVGHRSEQGLELNMENTLNQNIKQVEVMIHKGNLVEDIGDNMEMSTKNNEKGMEGMIFEVQETKKMLCMMRVDTKKGKKIFTEEIIWRNFQEKKKRRKMNQWLEKILKERDELEIIKLQIQGQREEVQQKLQDTITTILAMGEMKANIEKAVTEITNIQLEMLKTQRQMEKDKEDVQKYMDKLSSLNTCVSRQKLTESAIGNTFSANSSKLQEPHKEAHRDSLQDQTLEIPQAEERAAGEVTQGAMSLQKCPTLEDQHQNEEIKEQEQKQLFSLDNFLQNEKHEETLTYNEFSGLLINGRRVEEMDKQISELKEREERIKEQIHYAMGNMEKNKQEIERLIMDIYELQSQTPETGLPVTFRENGNVEGPLQETKQKYHLWLNTNVFKHETMTYELQEQMKVNIYEMRQEATDESDIMRLNIEKEIENQESKTDPLTHSEGLDSAKINTERDKLTKIRMRKDMEEMEKEILGLQSDMEKPILDCMDLRNSRTEEPKNSISQDEMLKPQNQVEWENMKKAKQKAEVEIHEMYSLRELEDRAQLAKREIREMELLRSELEIKRKEFEQMLRKSMRKKEQSENMLNELQKERELLRRETEKKRRELDQRLEKTIRERDELEVLRINLQIQREELAVEKQVRSKKEKAEMIHQASETLDLQTMRQKIHFLMEIIGREWGILENVNVHLGKQREGLKELHGENRNLRDNMVRVRSQIKLAFGKLSLQTEAEINQIGQMRDDVQKQKYNLDMGLEKVKRERRQMEVLNTEVDFKIRENRQMIRKGIRRDQEARQLWTGVKEEKYILKREARSRKKELDQQLERIIRERDELEMMKLKREKNDSQCLAEQQKASASTNAAYQIQKHWELINICMEKCKHIKKHSEGLHEAIQNEYRQFKGKAEILIQAREELEITIAEMKRQKDKMMCLFKSIQQKQRNSEEGEIHFNKESKAIEEDKKKGVEKSEEGVFKERKFLKSQRLILKVQQQKQNKSQKKMKRLLNSSDGEKESESLETKRKMMQIQIDEMKEEKPSDEQQKTIVLHKNKPLQMDIMMDDISKRGKQVFVRLDTEELQEKNKVEFGFNESNIANQQKDTDLQHMAGGRTNTDLSEQDKKIEVLTDERPKIRNNDKIKTEGGENNEELETRPKTTELKKQREQSDLLQEDTYSLKDDRDVYRMDLNNTNREVEAAMKKIIQEKKYFIQMKVEVEQERELLLIEKERMEGQWSDLKKRENKQMDTIKSIESLRIRHQELDARMSQEMNHKIIRLENNKEDILKLVSILEEKQEALGVHTIIMKSCTEMLVIEREGLKSLMSEIVFQRQDMENQLKAETLSGKKYLLKLKAELDEKREDLERLSEKMEQEKVVLNLMRYENQKQCDLLQQGEQDIKEEIDKLKLTKTELQQKKEHVYSLLDDVNQEKSNIKDLTLQVHTQRKKLQNVTNMIALKQREQDVKDSDIRRQIHELKTQKNSVLEEREELDVLRKDLNSKNLEVEAALKTISQEKETFIQMKVEVEKEGELLLIEKEQMGGQWSDLKKRENKQMETMKSIESLRKRHQELDARMSQEMNQKIVSLEQNKEDILKLVSILEEKQEALGVHKIIMKSCTEMLVIEREGLKSLMSEIVFQRQDMENQLKEETLSGKKYLLKLKAELDEKREDLERLSEKMEQEKVVLNLMRYENQKQCDLLQQGEQDIKEEIDKLKPTKTELLQKKVHVDSLLDDVNQEKSNIKDLTLQVHTQRKKLQNVTNMIALKQREQEVKDSDIRRQIHQLKTQKNSVLEEREELDVLRKDLNSKNLEVEAAMKTISQGKEDFIQMKVEVEKERELLLIEKERMERQWSELKKRENKQMDTMKSIESLRIRHQELDARMSQDMHHKIIRLEQNKEDILKLVSILEEKKEALCLHKIYMKSCTEMLVREREELRSLMSEILFQRHDMENQLKEETLSGKKYLLKLKAELDEKREDLERLSEKMEQEKVVLNLMRYENQKQCDLLQQGEQDIKEEIDKLKPTKTELLQKKVHVDSLLDDVNQEKSNIKDLTLQVHTQRKKLQNVTNMIALKQREQEVKDSDIRRQIHQLKPQKNSVLEEREELDVLRKDLNSKNLEVEAAMKTISQGKEDFIQMKVEVEKERELLLIEKERMERQWSELKKRENKQMDTMKSIESLRIRHQELDARMSQDMHHKIIRLEQNKEDILKLVSILEEKQEALGVHKIIMKSCTEMLVREREGLKSLMSEIVFQRQDMENQLKAETLSGKKYLLKLKAELDEKREDLERLSEKMEQEKVVLNLMRYENQKQCDLLQQGEQDIKEEIDKLKLTKTELLQKKEHVDSLLDDVNQEKSNIKDLTLQVHTKRKKLQNVTNMIDLKQREQEGKDSDIRRQIHELKTQKNSVLEEREELDVLMKDLNSKNLEVETALKTISQEKETFIQMKVEVEKERELLLIEKEQMGGQWSDLKKRENKQMDTMKSIESLRIRHQELDARMSQDMNHKIIRLEQNKEDILKLVSILEEKKEALCLHKIYMKSYTEMLVREREELRSLMSEILFQRHDMENQLKAVTLSEKKDLLKLKAELDQKRVDLERLSEKMDQEKVVSNLMRYENQKQCDLLQQDEQDIKEDIEKCKLTKTELQQKKEHVDSLLDDVNQEKSNIIDLTLQVHTQRKKLQNVTNMIALKQREQDVKDSDIRRQIHELKTQKNSVLEERKELDVLRKDLNSKNLEVEAAMKTISQEKETFIQMKVEVEKERELLLIEKEQMGGQWSDLKKRENKQMDTMKSIESLLIRHQELDARMSQDMNHKIISLEQNKEDILKLVSILEEKQEALGVHKIIMKSCTEMLVREREGLKSLMSEIVFQRQDMENQLKEETLSGKKYLLKLKAELDEKREDLERLSEKMEQEKVVLNLMRYENQKQCDLLQQGEQDIKEEIDKLKPTKTELLQKKVHVDSLLDDVNQEKSNIKDLTLQVHTQRKKLQNVTNMIALKQREQEVKDSDIRRQIHQLKTQKNSVLEEREELDVLRKDLNSKNLEVEAAMKTISQGKEDFIQMKVEVEKERELLLIEKERMERQWSELKKRENKQMDTMKSIESLRIRHQELDARMSQDMHHKIIRLEQNKEDILKLVSILEEKQEALGVHKIIMKSCTEMLVREREGLKSLMSEIVFQRQDMENQLKEETLSGKKYLLKLKAELDEKREDLERLSEKMEQEKVVLNLMRYENQKQCDLLQQGEQDIKEEIDKLKPTKTELLQKKVHVDSLLDDVNQKKSNIKDLTLQVHTQRKKLQNVTNMIALKQREQEVKDSDIRRQIHQLKTQKNSVLEEREELDVLRKDLNSKNLEVEAAMKTISQGKEDFIQMKVEVEKERELLLIEKERMERQWSELKKRENKQMDTMKSIESLRIRHQELDARMSQDMHHKIIRLEQNKEDILKLVSILEEKQEALGVHKIIMKSCTEMLMREREGLKSLMSEIVFQRQDMENQLKEETLSGKKYLLKLKAELDEKREDLERLSEKMEQEKVVLNLMRYENQKQCDLLQQGEQDIKEEIDKLKPTKTELLQKKVHVDSLLDDVNQEKSNIKDLTLQVHTQRKKLQNVTNMIALKQREQEVKDSDIRRQIHQLKTQKNSVLEEREELDVLRKDLNSKNLEVEAAMKTISQGKEDFIQMKVEVEKERELLLIEKERMERQWSELKKRENKQMDTMKSIESLRIRHQELDARMSQDMHHKIIRLEQNKEDILKLVSILEEKQEALGVHKIIMKSCTEMLVREREGLKSLMSEIVFQRQDMENQLKEETLSGKKYLLKLKAELDEKREDLERLSEKMEQEKVVLNLMRYENQKQCDLLQQGEQDIKEEIDKLKPTKTELLQKKVHVDSLLDDVNQEKSNIKDLTLQVHTQRKKLQNVTNMIALKQREQEVKDSDIRRQIHQLKTQKNSVLEEREELDVLRKDLNSKNLEVEAAMKTISQGKEDFIQMKVEVEKERELLLIEKERMERQWSELKKRENKQMDTMKSIESLRIRHQELDARMSQDMHHKIIRLEQNKEDILKLVSILEEKQEALGVHKIFMKSCTEMLVREREGLKSLISEIVFQRQDMENQLKAETLSGKKYLLKLKAELDEKREDLERLSEKMEQEKVVLNLMRYENQKQCDLLQQGEQDIKEEIDKLKLTKTELLQKKEHVDSLLDDVNQEKSNIKDLTLQVHTQRKKLQNVTNMIDLKQREQEGKDSDIRRQIHELKTQKNSVLEEREELDVLMKDLNSKNLEVETALKTISQEKETFIQMKVEVEKERELLLIEKEQMGGQWSDLKKRENKQMDTMKSIESLLIRHQELDARMSQDMNHKIISLEQNKEDILKLVSILEEKQEALGVHKIIMKSCTEMLVIEREGLKSLMSEIVFQRQDMENQLKEETLSGKKYLLKLKAELDEKREDLERLSEKMEQEKVVLNLMRYENQKQCDLLQQGEQDIKEEIDKLKPTKTELLQKKEHVDSLLDDVNQEKSNIKDLTLQVHTQRKKLQNVTNIIALKQREQEVKDSDIRRQIHQLKTQKNSVLEEREELDVLRKDLNSKNLEVEAAMKTISQGKEDFIQMKVEVEKERELLLIEKERMERQWSELKKRENKQMDTIKSIESLRIRHQELDARMSQDMHHKIIRLEQNKEDILKLVSILEEKQEALGVHKIIMKSCTEMLVREREGLKSLMSEIVFQRQDMENQLKAETLSGKKYLLKLKAELDQKREDLERLSEKMEQEKVVLNLMRYENQKQCDLLQQGEQDIKEEIDKLKLTKTELLQKKEHVDSLLDDENQEKSNIKDLTLQKEKNWMF